MSNTQLNISHNSEVKDCKNKCNLSFNFQESACVVENRGDYLQFKYDHNSSSVVFNGADYSITDVRLYQPSIHNYGSGDKAAAEIIILLKNTVGEKLAICAPIKESSSGSNAANFLETIVPQVSPTIGESSNVNLKNFTLKSFVPRAAYFYYKGSLPWSPNDPDYNFVVFSKKNALATIKSDTLLKLKKLLSEHKNGVGAGLGSNKVPLFFNSQGVSSGGGGDDIYIDCKPVGESEETQEFLQTTSGSLTQQQNEENKKEMEMVNLGLYIVAFIIGFSVLMYLSYVAYKFFEKGKPPSGVFMSFGAFEKGRNAGFSRLG